MEARRRLEIQLARATARVGRRMGVPPLRAYCPACERPIFAWLPQYRLVSADRLAREPEPRLCPFCGSFERTRHFALYLKANALIGARTRLLHFAPEHGLTRKLRAQLGDRYVTADLARTDVDRREDITHLSFEDDRFDVIYCSNVLEHVPDDTRAMRELFRVLEPGGIAIVQVPIRGLVTHEDPSITDPAERNKHFGQADHVRYYGEDIAERLRASGFEVTPFYMLDVLPLQPGDIERMNLDKRELIHACRKPQM